MENGEANPTLETLQRLVGVLRFTLVIKIDPLDKSLRHRSRR
jgi:hypothetical protein